ncbi:acetyl-CoA carboxylase biotin carboxyl carrier protein [Sneathiella chinensis]|uniref:Biotin carboxyl carrier protein of acetyl-CoA carboxylase n=1 Tax=Sneathiella chinensis TaxID=349750 RepID=A0ABQ5U764_9PROT|nr:acetyl-CoA carboxylase biotin carboxyl carrier protein [Sneathiella chinensis]GLQ07053.1 acetyl-CoA carboxylase, biotin carboxyl carrier protein [Sneathiella chinensis]
MSKFDIDRDAIRELAEIMNETGLGEIELESGNHRLRVSRNSSTVAAAPVVAAPVAAPVAAAAAPVAAEAAPAEAENHPGAVKSPMVGTAYLAPEPGAANFVSVGDSVSQGQTLLIVEAMKTMNPIAAPKGGKIVKVLVENEQPVEFGQPLVVIE